MSDIITHSLDSFWYMTSAEKHEYERTHSTFFQSNSNASYKECRAYSCESISKGLTKISIKPGKIIEIPYGHPFHFMGRVSTLRGYDKNTPNSIFEEFERRGFISFTTICNNNKSHYKGDIFFLYNIHPQDIVHVFPMDSDTTWGADCEEVLTRVPSLWLSLSDLEYITQLLGVYNQVTCRTKRYGNSQIIKPFAICAFDEVSDEVMEIANLFKIGIVLSHPNFDAINYDRDLLLDYFQLKEVSKVMEKLYGFSVMSMYYPD